MRFNFHVGFLFCLVPPSHKASADECSEGRSECLLFWGSVEVFLRLARRSFMRRRVFWVQFT